MNNPIEVNTTSGMLKVSFAIMKGLIHYWCPLVARHGIAPLSPLGVSCQWLLRQWLSGKLPPSIIPFLKTWRSGLFPGLPTSKLTGSSFNSSSSLYMSCSYGEQSCQSPEPRLNPLLSSKGFVYPLTIILYRKSQPLPERIYSLRSQSKPTEINTRFPFTPRTL